jgi:hypothetical protein
LRMIVYATNLQEVLSTLGHHDGDRIQL